MDRNVGTSKQHARMGTGLKRSTRKRTAAARRDTTAEEAAEDPPEEAAHSSNDEEQPATQASREGKGKAPATSSIRTTPTRSARKRARRDGSPSPPDRSDDSNHESPTLTLSEAQPQATQSSIDPSTGNPNETLQIRRGDLAAMIESAVERYLDTNVDYDARRDHTPGNSQQHPVLPAADYLLVRQPSSSKRSKKKTPRSQTKCLDRDALRKDAARHITEQVESSLLNTITHINHQRLRGSKRLPKTIRLKDSLRLFVVHICEYPSAQLLERRYSIAHSSFLEMVLPILRDWLGTWARVFLSRCWGDWESRSQIAHTENPEEFHQVTAIIDGTDTPMIKPYETKMGPGNTFYSYKLKTCGLRTQVMVLPGQVVGWVSESVPAARHDITVLRNSNVFSMLDRRDVVMFDKGYVGITTDFEKHQLSTSNTVIPRKKPHKGTLSDSEKQYNLRIGAVRIRIEQLFGQVKQRFAVLEHKFRHHREDFNPIFTICCAINNMLRNLHTLTFAESAADVAAQLLFRDDVESETSEDEQDSD